MCVCFSGHRGTDRHKAVPSGVEREKQREMESGDPDHEEVSFTPACIKLPEERQKTMFISAPPPFLCHFQIPVMCRTHSIHMAEHQMPVWQFAFIRWITVNMEESKHRRERRMTCSRGLCSLLYSTQFWA